MYLTEKHVTFLCFDDNRKSGMSLMRKCLVLAVVWFCCPFLVRFLWAGERSPAKLWRSLSRNTELWKSTRTTSSTKTLGSRFHS